MTVKNFFKSGNEAVAMHFLFLLALTLAFVPPDLEIRRWVLLGVHFIIFWRLRNINDKEILT